MNADDRNEEEPPLGRRLLWFAALWVGSLAGFAALAYGGRFLYESLGGLF